MSDNVAGLALGAEVGQYVFQHEALHARGLTNSESTRMALDDAVDGDAVGAAVETRAPEGKYAAGHVRHQEVLHVARHAVHPELECVAADGERFEGPEGVEQPADVDVGEIVIRPTAQT
jgi:hypothetical protein